MNVYNSDDFSVAFQIGPIYISWYGLLFTIGFLVFVLFSYIEWKKRDYDNFDFFILIIGGSLVALFGARIWYLMFNPADYQGFVSIFLLSSGRSILGSIFFGIIWIYYYTYFHASYIESRYALSIFLPNILIAQAIGRWGNFFQQDVYGNIVDNLNYLPSFIQEGMKIDGFYRQPLFLYESFLDFLGFVIILSFFKTSKNIKPGVHGGMYLLWYGVTRSVMELFRDDQFIMKINDVPTSFILSIIFAFWGIYLIIYYQYYFVKKEIWMNFQYKRKKEQLFSNFEQLILLFSFRTSFNKFVKNWKKNKKAYNLFVKNINLNKVTRFKKKIKVRY